MIKIKIYHNPRCSKSRETLKILNDRGLNIDIVLYMQNKITKKELKYLIFKLGISAEELIRKNEKIFKQIKLNDKNLSEEKLINYMLEEPSLIQRPIVEIKDKVIISRPPEVILDYI